MFHVIYLTLSFMPFHHSLFVNSDFIAQSHVDTMIPSPIDLMSHTILDKYGLQLPSGSTVDWAGVLCNPVAMDNKDITPVVRNPAMWGEGHNLKHDDNS